MNQVINKNLYDFHRRKLSQIKQNRKRLSKPLLQKPPDLKGQYLKKLKQITIQNQNMILIDKCKQVCRRSSSKNQRRQSISLNFNKRLNFLQKVHNQNLGIIKRLNAQKTDYPIKQYQKRCRYNSINNSSKSRVRTQLSMNRQQKKFDIDYEFLPILTDDFNQRVLIYSKIQNIIDQLCRIQISSTKKFYYVFLECIATKKNYKLRLVPQTGYHLIQLVKKDSDFFQKKILKIRNSIELNIPFSPFSRKYIFVELKTLGSEYKIESDQPHLNELLREQFDDESELMRCNFFEMSKQMSKGSTISNEEQDEYHERYINYRNEKDYTVSLSQLSIQKDQQQQK